LSKQWKLSFVYTFTSFSLSLRIPLIGEQGKKGMNQLIEERALASSNEPCNGPAIFVPFDFNKYFSICIGKQATTANLLLPIYFIQNDR
jgi:hypothetical protein